MQQYPSPISFGTQEGLPPMQQPTSPPKKPKEKDPVISFWKAQILVCLLVVAVVIFLRFIGGTTYTTLREQYIKRFCDVTSVDEVEKEETKKTAVVTPTVVETMGATVSQTAEVGDFQDDSLAIKENMLLLTGNTKSQNQMTLPVKGEVTSPFGYRIHPIYGTRMFHNGVDIGANSGTPIVATLTGQVEEADYNSSFGYYVILNHGSDFKTVYAHCSKITVSVGQTVQQGSTIALVGSTGVSTGPHLHFEVRRGEYRMNPAWLVNLS